MEIEVGKYYMDAEGKKRGPMSVDFEGWWDSEDSNGGYNSDGTSYAENNPNLIAEWTDEPAQTTTGTLVELNVKPGDVVEWPGLSKYRVMDNGDILSIPRGIPLKNGINASGKKWRIVSRASQSTTPASPVRTVTQKEIVPGVYGRVTVERLDNADWCFEVKSMRTADDLTAAIETLTSIRDALA